MSKRLMTLPVIGIVVAMLGASVFAASPSATDFKVYDHGTDVTQYFVKEDGFLENVTDPVLADIEGIQDKINSVDSSLKPADFSIVQRFNIHLNGSVTQYADPVDKVSVNYTTGSNEVAILVHYDKSSGTGVWKFVAIAKNASTLEGAVNGCSPFAIFKASAKSSAQTGEYVGTYIVMISVALVACGAVFAIRAKKTEN